jgi:16S rRNA (cytidine1402-2'-O)-methyltransferase
MVSSQTLDPGLYLVATPIGNARDITLRALDILAAADVLAAEDTRTARRLMTLHGVALGGRPLVPYHDHNGARARPRLLAELAAGRSVAYVSDAGTPLVADPGYRLAAEAAATGHPVTAAPGPSAALAALAVAGLPTDRFLFAGFPPSQAGPRRRWLEELAEIPATLVIFESAKRCSRSLPEMLDAFGPERRAALCRELTKMHEEVRRGTLSDIARGIAGDPPRGEVVLVVDRPGEAPAVDLDAALRAALPGSTLRDATDAVAEATGRPRREVYQAALRLREAEG